MDYISLMSSVTLLLASAIPFYFAVRLHSGPRGFVLLSVLLGLALLVHGIHHALRSVELLLVSLMVGLVSAVLVVIFAILYYMNWRSAVGHA